MNREVRRRHPRRRARGPHAGDPAAATLAALQVMVIERRAIRCAGRAQGRRIDGRDRRALLRHVLGLSEHLEPNSCASSASASSSPKARSDIDQVHRARRQPLSADAVAASSTAASSRTSSASRRARSACSSSMARSCAAIDLGATAMRASRAASSRTARRTARRPLGRRRLRPRRPAQAQARPGAGQRPRRQRGVVARRRHHRSATSGRRSGVARALRSAGPLALDQPHVRRRATGSG